MCVEKRLWHFPGTQTYVNRVIRRKETVVNRTFTRLIEALGYDILITYALNCNTAVIENNKSVSNLSSRTSIVIVKYKNTI